MLLEQINSPQDLKKLSLQQLPQLCSEIRNFIIDEVSENPGHFGASLGAVELAVALHYVLNTPNDKIVWDVGHQAYAHKILTGRRGEFHTNRKLGGISGFPRMSESIYDSFGTGHSSTSISAALGMAVAGRLQGCPQHIVAVIGDGSMTGGMAFEGLNHAGMEQADILVILNDNQIAIDKSVGALSSYLLKITTSATYNKVKNEVWTLTSRFQHIRRVFQKIGNVVKSSVLRNSNLFEALNFRYFGPVNGNDVIRLVKTLQRLQNVKGANLLHVLTVKGKGYLPAESNQTLWHAPGTFDRTTGKRQPAAKSQYPRYQEVFGETLLELAQQNDKIVGITPAMASGCSLDIMMQAMPHRAFDVGIAEQHAVTFSAGLAVAGYTPFCNLYSSFLQRAYDSIVHDVALQNLPVVFCIDRAGLVGEDGATHHGIFDIALLRNVPNMIVAAPMNETELRNMMYTAQKLCNAPFAIRYPRGQGVTHNWRLPLEEMPIGKALQLSDGKDIALLSIGHIGNAVQTAVQQLAQKGIAAAHYNMRFVQPIDQAVLHRVGQSFAHIVTIEDGVIDGGMGSAVAEFITTHHYSSQVTRLGIPNQFVEHGTIAQLQALCGFDAAGIAATVVRVLQN
ncbi:1-deoxy-D-xylulose-5-phosphate synthase [Bacteroidia bacterium]|nr:1-deoxy-D-xylulose-5-phosphate synthase [Bacteroidia bacterium]